MHTNATDMRELSNKRRSLNMEKVRRADEAERRDREIKRKRREKRG